MNIHFKNKNHFMKELPFYGALLFFTIYYAWRLFALAPWYDELYTYANFINVSPLYPATHWPLPNNHVFFSVLSAFLNLFGNSYIGLRGVSYLSAIFSLCGIYYLAKECFGRFFGLCAIFLYESLYFVNILAIQGRGYSLCSAFLILALIALYQICIKEKKRLGYILFAIALTGGLYTLVTSIYWILPICIAGGIFLLLQKKFRTLFQLILSSLAAACSTSVLYGILWACVGSNLIVTDAGSEFFMQSEWTPFREIPLYCIKRGMQFMLADRNVQGISRTDFIRDFRYFARDVIGSFFPDMGNPFLILILICLSVLLIYFFVGFIQNKNLQNSKQHFVMLISSCAIVFLPIILLIQSTYPFIRVFSFLGVFITLLFLSVLYLLLSFVKWNTKKAVGIVATLLSLGLLLFRCFSPLYNAPYYGSCEDVKEILSEITLTGDRTILTTEVTCQYALPFYEKASLRNELALTESSVNPDIVIIDKNLLNEEEDWNNSISIDSLPSDWIRNHMSFIYENDSYLLYQIIPDEP